MFSMRVTISKCNYFRNSSRTCFGHPRDLLGLDLENSFCTFQGCLILIFIPIGYSRGPILALIPIGHASRVPFSSLSL